MKKHHSERGLTRVEVLVVVIACMALLPILHSIVCHFGGVAYRNTCGSHLSRIGKVMMIYANDYSDELPRAAGPGCRWSARTPDWKAVAVEDAYGVGPSAAARASISSSLYLLVKHYEVDSNCFLCTDEDGITEFKPEDYGISGRGLSDLWDFGPDPPKHVSFAYHQPYNPYFLSFNSPPGLVIAADRNPWMDSPFAKGRPFAQFKPDIDPFDGTTEEALAGNAIAHNGDGQNVLFLDSHVEFSKRPYCGLDDDNIYTEWDGADKVRGKPAQFGSVPADREDSLLVNDPAVPPAR